MPKITKEPQRFYNEYRGATRTGSTITITARAGGVEHPGTIDIDTYARLLWADLGKLIAEFDRENGRARVYNGIDLAEAGDGARFTLFVGKEKAGEGEVTRSVLEAAFAWLKPRIDPPNVVPFHGKRAS